MAAASASSTGGPLVIQAEEQMSLGRKEAAKWSMFSGTDKWENAARHFKSAGNFYKAAMKWEDSYNAYMEARAAFVKFGESSEELQMMREAAQVLTHQDAKRAATMLETELVPRLVEAGKLDEVAKMHRSIAETVKEDDIDLCMEHYRKAADMFLSAGSKSDMVKCKLKIAEMSAEHENYAEAITLFVEAAEVRLEKDLTRLSARDHLMDAGICVLATDDLVHCKESLERWCGMDYTFEDSREGRLIATLIRAAEENKVEDFADAVFDFDRIKKLSPWRTKILLRVKDVVGGGDDDAAEDLT